MNKLPLALTLAVALATLGTAQAADSQFTFKQNATKLKVDSVAAAPGSTPPVTNPPASPTLTYIAEASTSALTFGELPTGQSAAQSVLFSNTGTGTLTLTAPTITGPDFSSTTNCSTSLAPQQSCSVSVTYAPVSSGSSSGQLLFNSNATAGPLTASLSGSAYHTDPYYASVAFHLNSHASAGTALSDGGPRRAGMHAYGTYSVVPGMSPYGAAGRSFKTNGGWFAPQTTVALGSGSFTYETWVYFDGPLTYKANGGPYIASILGNTAATTASPEIFLSGSGTAATNMAFSAAASSSPNNVGVGYNFAAKTWYHIAAVRNNGTMTLYVNGQQVTSQPISGGYSTFTPQIGAQSFSGWQGFFNGYLSDTRLTVGITRYTGTSFSVPTAPLPTR